MTVKSSRRDFPKQTSSLVIGSIVLPSIIPSKASGKVTQQIPKVFYRPAMPNPKLIDFGIGN